MVGVTTRTLHWWLVQPRRIRCGSCGARFVVLARTRVAVSSVGILVPFETEAHQHQRLTSAYEREVARLRSEPAGLGRCPRCRAWQPWMVSQARPMALVTGLLVGGVLGIFPMIAAFSWMPTDSPRALPVALAVDLVCAVIGAAVGAVFPLVLEPIRHRTELRTMTPEDFDRLTEEATRAGIPAAELWARKLGWDVHAPLPVFDVP